MEQPFPPAFRAREPVVDAVDLPVRVDMRSHINYGHKLFDEVKRARIIEDMDRSLFWKFIYTVFDYRREIGD